MTDTGVRGAGPGERADERGVGRGRKPRRELTANGRIEPELTDAAVRRNGRFTQMMSFRLHAL